MSAANGVEEIPEHVDVGALLVQLLLALVGAAALDGHIISNHTIPLHEALASKTNEGSTRHKRDRHDFAEPRISRIGHHPFITGLVVVFMLSRQDGGLDLGGPHIPGDVMFVELAFVTRIYESAAPRGECRGALENLVFDMIEIQDKDFIVGGERHPASSSDPVQQHAMVPSKAIRIQRIVYQTLDICHVQGLGCHQCRRVEGVTVRRLSLRVSAGMASSPSLSATATPLKTLWVTTGRKYFPTRRWTIKPPSDPKTRASNTADRLQPEVVDGLPEHVSDPQVT